MKKSILLFLLFAVKLQAQVLISPITINLPANPPANTEQWGSGTIPFIITAQTRAQPGSSQVNGIVQESKILVTIKRGGSKVCGMYTPSTAPASGFNTLTKVWSGATANGLLGQNCTLAPGDYELCVQFLPLQGAQKISEDVCKPFTIAAATPTNPTGVSTAKFTPPTNILPNDGKALTEAEGKLPINFRWTPLVPKPQNPVTYRLRVWQLMQGQNATTAIKANTPTIEKEVKEITQAVVSNLYTGPCRPPYLCDFVWDVQALNTDGNVLGTSTPTQFSINAETKAETGTLENTYPADKQQLKPEDAKKPLTFRWTPIRPKPQNPVTYRLKVWQLMQGQNATAAMKTNKAVVEREVKDKTEFTKANLMGDIELLNSKASLVWKVDATNEQGVVIGSSEPTNFQVFMSGGCRAEYDAKIDTVQCVDYNHVVVIGRFICISSGYGPNPGYTQYPTQVTSASLIALPSNTLLTTTGVVPTVNQGGVLNFALPSSAIPIGTNKIVLHFTTKVLAPGYNCIGEANDTIIKPNCNCDPCSYNQITATNNLMSASSTYPGRISMSNNISVTPNKVKRVRADLVMVRVTPKTNDCVKCNKEPQHQGNFITNNMVVASSTQWVNSGQAKYAGDMSVQKISRSLLFESSQPNGSTLNGPIQHTIGVAPVSCCGDEVEIWIKYTIWDVNCKVCEKLVKKTITRDGSCNSTTTGNSNGSSSNSGGSGGTKN